MFSVDDLRLFLLLFADDAVLFSYTAEGLQKLLDNLIDYCIDYWRTEVNTSKTVVMVCGKSNRTQQENLHYNNIRLNLVNKFTYLGVTITSNGIFSKLKSLCQIKIFKKLCFL